MAPVAFLTGAAVRVGAVVARHLHQAGYNLVIHYRHSQAAAIALQTELNTLRLDSVALVQGDLLQISHLPALAAEAVARFGRMDLLLNNASTFYPTTLGQVTEAQWEDLLGSNLKAPFFLAQALVPNLRATQGCIINIADIYAKRPLIRYPVYSIAKAGLVMLTQALARELAPEVRVNAIAPGAILWPEGVGPDYEEALLKRIPLRRCGDPTDIARAVLYLAQAPYVTGQVLAVDGGRSISG